MKGLSTSEVAKECDVNVETIRYYERRNLIPEVPRTESGYRVFSTDIVDRIKFIKRAQQLDFSLTEIKKLIGITENDSSFTAQEIQQFAENKLAEIESKISGLKNVQSILHDLLERCSGKGSICECPIIQSLSVDGNKQP
ncbi:MerR family transcriptional regulator [Aquibacillus salsiterrae]|uniref:Mercuric resistance operon regulatory protein n=1 Tax=Aquibacillus salsiterrae TaxID=2950439 RepID=A0A9X3WK98_9BACI|nr:MerR family transcriptional regulator [Aquibacillus salsiterrae]MDC3418636.1 MerR family transcriptional regulator [Aquibacillus salsiterrae]